jgi:hypothetical protein
MLVVSLYTSSGAVFEKLPAIPRAPTKLRGFHRGTTQQRGSHPIIATTKATGQVLTIQASALYTLCLSHLDCSLWDAGNTVRIPSAYPAICSSPNSSSNAAYWHVQALVRCFGSGNTQRLRHQRSKSIRPRIITWANRILG